MTDTKYAVPTVTPNGTAKDEMMGDLKDAVKALADALLALNRVRPHGRDYPLLAEYKKALDEQVSRLTRIDEVRQEVIEVMNAVYQMADSRP